jgi:hypothetical protein
MFLIFLRFRYARGQSLDIFTSFISILGNSSAKVGNIFETAKNK